MVKQNTNSKQNTNALLMNSINGSNTLMKLFCTLTIIVIICIMIGHYAFKNGTLTCDHYVFNTYLYIILAILLMFMVVLLNDQTGMFNSLIMSLFGGNLKTRVIVFIIFIILYIALIYIFYSINPQNILASNVVWFILILLLGFFLIPIMWLGRLTDVVSLAGVLTLAITTIVGLLGYYYGNEIVTFDWDTYLFYALMGLVIISIFGPFFITTPKSLSTFILAISIMSLLIFVLLLLSNHKSLKESADKCIDGKVVPNYPVESYTLVYKIVNIFKDLIIILSKFKGKGKK